MIHKTTYTIQSDESGLVTKIYQPDTNCILQQLVIQHKTYGLLVYEYNEKSNNYKTKENIVLWLQDL